MTTKSKLISGYLKAMLRHKKLEMKLAKLEMKLAKKEAALAPLKRKIVVSELRTKEKFAKLHGGQIQTANKLWEELSSAEDQRTATKRTGERKKRRASLPENQQ